MFPAPRQCPVCREDLILTRLECRSCDTSIQGHYQFSGLSQLSAEQLVFVETFIRCEGKLNRVEKELSLSYPTLRLRLHEVIRALGYTVGDAPQDVISETERASILDRISEGELSAEEAMGLLEK
jgi:hypothetical protein